MIEPVDETHEESKNNGEVGNNGDRPPHRGGEGGQPADRAEG